VVKDRPFSYFSRVESQVSRCVSNEASGICSDHFPLHLDSVNGHRGKRRFKFENMWLKKEDFGTLVKQW
jgi:hypothetical protein